MSSVVGTHIRDGHWWRLALHPESPVAASRTKLLSKDQPIVKLFENVHSPTGCFNDVICFCNITTAVSVNQACCNYPMKVISTITITF